MRGVGARRGAEREREREVNASESKCAFFFDARETERVRFFRFLCMCPPGVFPARGNRQTQTRISIRERDFLLSLYVGISRGTLIEKSTRELFLRVPEAHYSTLPIIHKRTLSVSLAFNNERDTLTLTHKKKGRDVADAVDVDEQNRVLDWRDDVVFNATCASGDDEDDDDDDDDDEKKKKERNANERRERRRKWVRLARRPDSEEVFASSAERESRLLLHRRVADIESFDFHHSETFSPRGWERYRSERTHELRGVDDVGERGERYERDRERRANESEESV